MSVFLIDFENVHSAGLLGVDRLTENDRVYIFYSANSNSISFEGYKLLKASKAEIIPLLASCGMKNALDFQLASFMGYLAGVSKDRDLFVISLDKGYSFVQTFWEKTMQCTNFNIRFAPHIKKCLAPETIGVIDTEITDRAVFGMQPQESLASPSAEPAALTVEDMPKKHVSHDMAAATKERTSVHEEIVPENAAVFHEDIVPENTAVFIENEPVLNNENIPKDNVINEEAAGDTPEAISGNITENASREGKEPETLQAAPLPDKATERQEVPMSESGEMSAEREKAFRSQPETENAEVAAIIEAAGVNRESTKIICELVISSKDKQQFYTGMTKAFGMEAGIKIYTSLKSEYVNLKKLLGSTGNATLPENAAPVKKAAGGRKKADSTNVKQGKSQITAIVNKTGVKNVQTNVICDLVTGSKDKQQFYTGMTKAFGMEAGLKIYKSLKPEYLNLKKLLQAT